MEDIKEDLMRKRKQPHPFKGIGGYLEGNCMIQIGQSSPPLCHYLDSSVPTLILIGLSNPHVLFTHYQTEICYTFTNVTKNILYTTTNIHLVH